MRKRLFLIMTALLACFAVVSCDKSNDETKSDEPQKPVDLSGTMWLGTSDMVEMFDVYGANMSLKGREPHNCFDTIQLHFSSAKKGVYYKAIYDSLGNYKSAKKRQFDYDITGKTINIGLAGADLGDSINRKAVYVDENSLIFNEQGKDISMKKTDKNYLERLFNF